MESPQSAFVPAKTPTGTALPPERQRFSQDALMWLLQVLLQAHWLSKEQCRYIQAHAAVQTTRLHRLGQSSLSHGQSHQDRLSAAEVIASFQLKSPQGHKLCEERIAQILAQRAEMPYLLIDPLRIDMALATQTLSAPFALRHVVLPLEQTEQGLKIALDNPFDTHLLETLANLCKVRILPHVASKKSIYKQISEIYGFRKSVESAAKEQQAENHEWEQLVHLPKDGSITANDQHIVNAVHYLFAYALDQRASDIHIEPKKETSQIRMRIDGVLHPVHTIPKRVHAAFVSRIKTLARLDVAEKRRPQDGRIKTRLNERAVEMRVSTLPTAQGEKTVLRLFDPAQALQSLESLGLTSEEMQTFQRWTRAPHGLILVTGPTGSGKTTTLYAALRQLAKPSLNVTTIEDPIEILCDAFNQVAVHPKIGWDFAQALRTILRQDPDVIMVGEIRDAQTAHMAIQAALTGHLVFSTLHTNDSFGAVSRLLDLGVEPFLLGSVLQGVVAQRLMRRLCTACQELDPNRFNVDVASCANPTVYHGRGCAHCRQTGFVGRLGVFEMLDVTPSLRRAILAGAEAETLRALAIQSHWQCLSDKAWQKVLARQSSIQEWARMGGQVRADAT